MSRYYTFKERFGQGLAIIYFYTFAWLFYQVDDLWGPQGVIRINELFQSVKQSRTVWKLVQMPSLLWFSTDISYIRILLLIGGIAGFLAFWKSLRTTSLLICLVIFMSFMTTSDSFIVHLWDRLLLESTLLLWLISMLDDDRGNDLRNLFKTLASFLALLLIDDRSIRWLWKVTTVLPQRQTVNGKWYFWLQFFGIEKVAVGVFVLLLPAHILHLSYAFDKGHGLVSDQWVDYYYQDSQSKGAPVQVLAGYLKWISRFHLVNEYGVFGGHPLARYRFAFESSDDAQSWHSLNIGGDLLDEKRPPLFSFIFHERFNTNLWLMGQGLEFVRLQKHHDLYSQIPSMGELICHWLKKKSPTSMALRIRAESCKFLDIGEFRWKNGNWWSCQPAGEEYVCH